MGAPSTLAVTVDPLHARFLALLPRIEVYARLAFRDVRCPAQRQDGVAEAVALAWKWFVALAQRGKDAAGFVSVLATFAARAVRCGRRVTGQEKSTDVLSPTAQRRHGFVVGTLPAVPTSEPNPWDEALVDNTHSAVPDQVCFRMDYPRWRRTRTARDRRVLDDLMVGSRTQEVARKHGLTAGRISQLRRAFAEDWQRFCGDGDEARQSPAETERRQPCPA